MSVYIEKSGDLVGCYHSGTTNKQTKRKDRATQPMDHGRLRWAKSQSFLGCSGHPNFMIPFECDKWLADKSFPKRIGTLTQTKPKIHRGVSFSALLWTALPMVNINISIHVNVNVNMDNNNKYLNLLRRLAPSFTRRGRAIKLQDDHCVAEDHQ